VDRPPNAVLHAFGVDRERLAPLAGGQGCTWAAGEVVLRPVKDDQEAVWIADVLAELPQHGFRISRPIEARTGGWVTDGWTAWSKIDGRHDFSPTRWREVFAVCRRFHDAIRTIQFPHFLSERTDAWADGDRTAWDEESIDATSAELRPVLEGVVGGLRPLALPPQVIHGDLGGNVLFADGQPAAVIDFSPYHRPAAFALAVVANDAIAWYDAPTALVDELGDVDELAQLLRRAVIYRLVTADRLAADRPGIAAEHAEAHQRVIALIEALER
jgi:uncharacterized protein (TIGR02569 family)